MTQISNSIRDATLNYEVQLIWVQKLRNNASLKKLCFVLEIFEFFVVCLAFKITNTDNIDESWNDANHIPLYFNS